MEITQPGTSAPGPAAAKTTLIVTNDFPPRFGGIQAFVHALANGLPPQNVLVYTSSSSDQNADRDFDARQPYRIIRDRSRCLLPTPRVARATAELVREHGCTSVLYGAAAPLGLLAPALAKAGATRQVALTHGHEVWWARIPGSKQMLHRIGEHVDVITYLGRFTHDAIGAALSQQARQRMRQLTPGVDSTRFHPGAGGARVRERYGLGADQPLVLCLSRLVARKGQDQLIRVWPQVLAQVPEAVLLLVGTGPDEQKLRALARSQQVDASVIFAGASSDTDLPAYHDAATVFAMPCRDRRGGLEAEGLGICYLEAQASAVPVIVGTSGGAPDACRDGETGFVVDGRDQHQLTQHLVHLLTHSDQAAAMGQAGRQWVLQRWDWQRIIPDLKALLEGTGEGGCASPDLPAAAANPD